MYLRILPVITIPVLITINLPPELPPPPPEPIPIVEIAPPPPPVTWESNPNGCDEATQYIASEEPFYCIDKAPVAKKTAVTPQNGSSGLNGYVRNSCTGWVASHRYVPPGWGNASSWKYHAQQAGWYVGNTPIVGAIGWTYGHVVFVTAINGDGTLEISERNYDYRGSVRTITVPVGKYIYLY